MENSFDTNTTVGTDGSEQHAMKSEGRNEPLLNGGGVEGRRENTSTLTTCTLHALKHLASAVVSPSGRNRMPLHCCRGGSQHVHCPAAED